MQAAVCTGVNENCVGDGSARVPLGELDRNDTRPG